LNPVYEAAGDITSRHGLRISNREDLKGTKARKPLIYSFAYQIRTFFVFCEDFLLDADLGG